MDSLGIPPIPRESLKNAIHLGRSLSRFQVIIFVNLHPSHSCAFIPFITYTFSLPEDIGSRARQIQWVDEHFIVVLTCSSEDSFGIDCLSGFQMISEKTISQLWRISLDSKLIRMLVDEITGRLILEDTSGHLFEGMHLYKSVESLVHETSYRRYK